MCAFDVNHDMVYTCSSGDTYMKKLFTPSLACFRDLRLLSIGGGADEVMLSIICKYMRTLPDAQKKK